MEQDDQNLDSFIECVAIGQFKDVRDVRILPGLLGDPDAAKIFRSPQGDIVKARNILALRDPTITSQTFAAVKKTIEALRAIPRSEFIQATHDYASVKVLKEVRLEVDGLLDDIGKMKAEPSKNGE